MIAAPKQRTLRHSPADDYRLKPGRVWLCVGPNCWGKAFSPQQAEENAMKNGSKTGWRFVMYDAPPDTYIDGMGASCYRPCLYTSAETMPTDPRFKDYQVTDKDTAHCIGDPAVAVYSWGMPKG